ncbi:histidine phosphatase family protein [Mesorhizobium sp. STM 4661]|uniref:SixA phosphatase family protein n=1 Tax=Mesorhizobium sp. STM 4661 TaxID=1297570 RepID=UPI0002BF41E3|nr:histidine phosphatase family protein [Mesorhizobium sp. STM 4661]CCV14132.1 putative phosphohistidine phosphatase, SixA [Mesorhizobium sp. STM 4661]
MSRLYLLRHARAGWALPGVRDFDRPLDASGVADAEMMGALMRVRNYVPDLTLCSNAKRARQTLEGLALEGLAGHTDTGRVLFFDTLYSEDAAFYLAAIRDHGGPNSGGPDSLLVIGHNPMTEDLALALSGDGDEAARGLLNHGFPTSGLAVVRFPGNLANVAQGAGYLETFMTPADP